MDDNKFKTFLFQDNYVSRICRHQNRETMSVDQFTVEEKVINQTNFDNQKDKIFDILVNHEIYGILITQLLEEYPEKIKQSFVDDLKNIICIEDNLYERIKIIPKEFTCDNLVYNMIKNHVELTIDIAVIPYNFIPMIFLTQKEINYCKLKNPTFSEMFAQCFKNEL